MVVIFRFRAAWAVIASPLTVIACFVFQEWEANEKTLSRADILMVLLEIYSQTGIRLDVFQLAKRIIQIVFSESCHMNSSSHSYDTTRGHPFC